MFFCYHKSRWLLTFFFFQWLSFCFNHVSFLYTAMIVYRVLFFVPKKTVKMIHTLLQCITIIVIIFGLKVGLSLESQRPQVPLCLKHHDLLLNMLFFLWWSTRLAFKLIYLIFLLIHSTLIWWLIHFLTAWQWNFYLDDIKFSYLENNLLF